MKKESLNHTYEKFINNAKRDGMQVINKLMDWELSDSTYSFANQVRNCVEKQKKMLIFWIGTLYIRIKNGVELKNNCFGMHSLLQASKNNGRAP